MNLQTNLHGRLRNTSLPYTHGLSPLFEAVSNSIHAIEELNNLQDDGKILIEIIRDNQSSLSFDGEKKRGPEVHADITDFKIIDNGIGFNDENMDSFLTLDGDYKADKGGRGVGRLLWLKAFENVKIESFFKNDEEKLLQRSFVFNASKGVDDVLLNDAPLDASSGTTVYLKGFKNKYRETTYKNADKIANSLLYHCLWYFVRPGGSPKIFIIDGTEKIDLDNIYENQMISNAVRNTIKIKGFDFDLTHIKLGGISSKSHYVVYCAANRLVSEEKIDGIIPGLYGILSDNSKEFTYKCYVSSLFLDERVRAERTEFDISENTLDLLEDIEISMADIKKGVIENVTKYLSEYLEENRSKSKERINNYVSNKAPRYRPIMSRIPECSLYVDPSISDKDLELHLHKHLAEIEGKLLADGHEILNPRNDEGIEDYYNRISDYMEKVENLKQSDLVDYVFHRRAILDLLEKFVKKDESGKYPHEEMIHKLIFPMKTDSNNVMYDAHNLWLIDERLAFHDYLASDKSIKELPITNSNEDKRPDICLLNVFDNPVLFSESSRLPLASITVVEIKRPMRNDAAEGESKDPIQQALDYLDLIRQGKVKTSTGRPIPESMNIPGFCYIICDLTPTMIKRCEHHDALKTSDNLGYFIYHKHYNSYVEVISFDRLINLSKERNRAFFDKLGLPTK